MTEISAIIRARLNDGRSISDEDVRSLLNENDRLREGLRDVLPYVDTCNSSHREAQAKGYAALEGKEDEAVPGP